jgi:hypothetical protein
VGTKGAGGQRRLAAQVKLGFTIGSKDEDCRKTFSGFWSDFRSVDRFDSATDRLVLVTLRGTDALLKTFNSLLDCARASADGTDFARRVTAVGCLSKKAQRHAATIKTIIAESDGEAPSNDCLWQFLRVVHVVSFGRPKP